MPGAAMLLRILALSTVRVPLLKRPPATPELPLTVLLVIVMMA